MSVEQYLDMSDEQLQNLIAHNHGEVLEDPWFGSTLTKMVLSAAEDEDYLADLTDLPNVEKYTDLDIDYTITGLED